MNHELWLEMGRLHERRGEIDDAWSCYDHVQQLRPHLNERDRFLERLKGDMDGKEKQPWSGPTIAHRESFLERMQTLTDRVSTPTEEELVHKEDAPETHRHPDETKLEQLVAQGDHQAAFFLARRLLAGGEAWAEPWLTQIQEAMK